MCAGPLLVKAMVLTVVDRLHAAGYGKMYTELPATTAEVCSSDRALPHPLLLHETLGSLLLSALGREFLLYLCILGRPGKD